MSVVSQYDIQCVLYGLGKSASLKKIVDSNYFCDQAAAFNEPGDVSQSDVVAAGEKALVCLYGGRPESDLNELRYTSFCRKAAKSKKTVQAESLPPTSAAAKYHSLRTYYQIHEWKGKAQTLQPNEWGWRLDNGKLLPITTDLSPAPSHLLEVIRCNCKTGCHTFRCCCKKNDIKCTPACGECKGISCNNSQQPDLEED